MNNVIDMKHNNSFDLIDNPSNSIRNGKLVIFPTETVYGIGANGLDSKAVLSIFEAKGRKTDNPLILHVSDMEMVHTIAQDINDIENKLMTTFWPGPLTMVLNKKDIVPFIVTGGLNTVGIRMPSNKIALELIKRSNTPIAAPSANVSGKPSGTTVSDIIAELGDKVDYVIDGGETLIGVESTVLRVINDDVHILRPGYITKEMIESLGLKVIIEKHILQDIKEGDVIMSPGMKYKHYAPETRCVLVYSDDEKSMLDKMQEIEKSYDKALVLTRNKNVSLFKNTILLGNTLDDISHNIFKALRQVDRENADIVIIEGVSKEGLGLAIMNRLIRACSHNYIEITK